MILGISGKKNSGKDTVGKIIQILTQSPHFTDEAVEKFLKREILNPVFENKKFADMLKDTVCMWIGCTREQLEDEEFKNKPLGSHWDIYDLGGGKIVPRGYYGNEGTDYLIAEKRFIRKMTPRLLLQLVGTECGRNIIHPNIWVNSLMSGYKALNEGAWNGTVIDYTDAEFPNWVITDMRFPNEMEAVKARDGLTIRVNRWVQDELTEEEARDLFHDGKQVYAVDDEGVEALVTNVKDFSDFSRFVTEVNRVNEHISETALDDCEDFDYTFNNDERLVDLIHMVRLMLKKEKII